MSKSEKRATIAKAALELNHDMRMLVLAFPHSAVPESLRDAAEEKFMRVLDSINVSRPASLK